MDERMSRRIETGIPREDVAHGPFPVEVKFSNHRELRRAAAGAIRPSEVPTVQEKGFVNSGVMRVFLPDRIARELNLPSAGVTKVRFGDGRVKIREMVMDLGVELFGRRGTYKAVVEPDRTTALIGAIVLEDLDFLVDCTHQTLQPRDPDLIVSEIE